MRRLLRGKGDIVVNEIIVGSSESLHSSEGNREIDLKNTYYNMCHEE